MAKPAVAAVPELDDDEVEAVMPATDQNGRPIVGFGVVLRKTGDGLSESMQTEPKPIKQGDVVYIVYEAVCVDVHYPVEDRKEPGRGGVEYIPVLDALTAVFLDRDLVITAIDDMAAKNQARKAREKDAGTIFDPDHGGEAVNAQTGTTEPDDDPDDDDWTDEDEATRQRLDAGGIDTGKDATDTKP